VAVAPIELLAGSCRDGRTPGSGSPALVDHGLGHLHILETVQDRRTGPLIRPSRHPATAQGFTSGLEGRRLGHGLVDRSGAATWQARCGKSGTDERQFGPGREGAARRGREPRRVVQVSVPLDLLHFNLIFYSTSPHNALAS